MVPGEPLWTEDDTQLAIEWQQEKALRCEGCGHPLDETLPDEAIRDYEAHQMTCHGCQVVEWRRTTLSEQEADMAGLRIYATRKR